MATFKDNSGREWALSLDVFMLEQIRDKTGFDADTCLHDEMAGLGKLMADSPKCARVVYLLCEGQADALKVSPEQFGRAIGGPSLHAMKGALLQAFADFSPPHLAKLIRAMVTKGEEVSELAAQQGMKAIAAIDPESFVSAMTSPASSESIPPG